MVRSRIVYPALGPRHALPPRPFRFDLQSSAFVSLVWGPSRGGKPITVEPKPSVLGAKHPPNTPLESPYSGQTSPFQGAGSQYPIRVQNGMHPNLARSSIDR
ncbi:unnamed protein product [Penicillium manginii]